MTDLPLISVVIPARNEEAYIPRALASVATQTYPLHRLECVVVDNGSSDRTILAARAVSAEIPGLTVTVVSEPVPGVGRAKNQGAEIARGSILIFLDADSLMEAGLASDVEQHYRNGYPIGSIRVIADSKHPIDRGFFALMEVGKVLFGVRSQMMYCERSLFLSLTGFQPDLALAEDLEFLKRAREYLHARSRKEICHIRSSWIATSPRRLRERPYHLGTITMFARWVLAFMGIGRTRHY